jgi:MFS family permease
VLVAKFVPESPIKTLSRVDFPGALLLSGGLVALLLGLTEGESWGWGSGRIVSLFAVGLMLLVLWVVVELRVPEPMVDMRMMVRRPVLLTNITAIIAGFAMFSVFVLVPNFVETPTGLPPELAQLVDYGFGASATKAGLYLLPSAIVLLFAGPIGGLLGRRVGFKWPLAIGMALVSVAAAMLALWNDEPWQVVASQPIFGVGIGFAFAAMATIIAQSVRPSETGVASGMNTVMRTVGGVVGGQVGAALLTAHTIPGTTVPSVDGYEIAFALGSAAALVGAAVAVFITRPQPGRRREAAFETG